MSLHLIKTSYTVNSLHGLQNKLNSNIFIVWNIDWEYELYEF